MNWIIDFQKQTKKFEIDTEAQACYALALSQDHKQLFACCADGKIVIWDLVSESQVIDFKLIFYTFKVRGLREKMEIVDFQQNASLQFNVEVAFEKFQVIQHHYITMKIFDFAPFRLELCPVTVTVLRVLTCLLTAQSCGQEDSTTQSDSGISLKCRNWRYYSFLSLNHLYSK